MVLDGYLMLDVLIGNQDRHDENWAIIINEVTKDTYLSPSYDHSAGLARGLSDQEGEEKLKTKDKNR